MCFSETASFTGAAILSAQAAASFALVKKEKDYSYSWFILIPLFFALQQFSEGMIWHTFNHTAIPEILPDQHLPHFFAAIFLMIAFLAWPILIPLSLFFPEKDKFKKKILFLFVVFGLIWSFYLSIKLEGKSLSISTEGRGVIYQTNYFREEIVSLLRLIYIGLLIIPMFITSLRLMWLFGIFTIGSAVVADYFYATSFTSVWCFFGALLSLILYFVLKVNLQKEKFSSLN